MSELREGHAWEYAVARRDPATGKNEYLMNVCCAYGHEESIYDWVDTPAYAYWFDDLLEAQDYKNYAQWKGETSPMVIVRRPVGEVQPHQNQH